nr:hypothetical protein CFP56_78877 [Quercus suber]
MTSGSRQPPNSSVADIYTGTRGPESEAASKNDSLADCVRYHAHEPRRCSARPQQDDRIIVKWKVAVPPNSTASMALATLLTRQSMTVYIAVCASRPHGSCRDAAGLRRIGQPFSL